MNPIFIKSPKFKIGQVFNIQRLVGKYEVYQKQELKAVFLLCKRKCYAFEMSGSLNKWSLNEFSSYSDFKLIEKKSDFLEHTPFYYYWESQMLNQDSTVSITLLDNSTEEVLQKIREEVYGNSF